MPKIELDGLPVIDARRARRSRSVISGTDTIRLSFCRADLSRLVALGLPNVRPVPTVLVFVCVRKPINNHVAKRRADADSTVK